MYITDATHFLDEKGAIGPKQGPARKIAEFFGAVIVTSTSPAADQTQPVCFKCSGSVKAHAPVNRVIEWRCSGCGESGRITNWEGTLWDMTMVHNKPVVEH